MAGNFLLIIPKIDAIKFGFILQVATGNYSQPATDWLNVLFRLILSLILGAIIGLERQLKHKPAGLRTHMLVSFGSAILVLIPLELGAAQQNFDAVSRVIQGIAAGIGFIGAGEILTEAQPNGRSSPVRGLTSAAAIWVSAALGIAAGCGLWQLGLIGAILCWLVLSIFKILEPLDTPPLKRRRILGSQSNLTQTCCQIRAEDILSPSVDFRVSHGIC